jgi:leucyl-tRNA synthetase
MILGADGFKMSKSLGNTVSPDEYILKYGSDAFRIYLGFGFAYTEGGPWNDGGIKAASRFLARAERLSEKISDYSVLRGVTAADIYKDMAGASNPLFANYERNSEKELQYAANYAIKSAGADIERIQFNTSISRSMELLNALYKYDAEVADGNKNPGLFIGVYTAFIRLIAPFAPHFCEDRWEAAGLPYSIFSPETWPQYSEAALKKDFVEMAVQVNGIVRFRMDVPRDASDSDIETAVKNDGRLPAFLTAAGKNGAQAEIVKIIIVRGRLISIVAK